MDLEDQWKISKLIAQYEKETVIVLLGCPDAESSQIQAETVTIGDPSMVGPLAGKKINLEVYHIIEDAILHAIPKEIYQKYITPYNNTIDSDSIQARMYEVRQNATPNTSKGR